MNQTVNHIILALIATVTLVSCNNGASLQRYFVDH